MSAIGADDAPVKKEAKRIDSDDDTILFQPKMKNLREDADVVKLLQGGVFQNIDKLRKAEGADEVTITPVQAESDKDIKFK